MTILSFCTGEFEGLLNLFKALIQNTSFTCADNYHFRFNLKFYKKLYIMYFKNGDLSRMEITTVGLKEAFISLYKDRNNTKTKKSEKLNTHLEYLNARKIKE